MRRSRAKSHNSKWWILGRGKSSLLHPSRKTFGTALEADDGIEEKSLVFSHSNATHFSWISNPRRFRLSSSALILVKPAFLKNISVHLLDVILGSSHIICPFVVHHLIFSVAYRMDLWGSHPMQHRFDSFGIVSSHHVEPTRQGPYLIWIWVDYLFNFFPITTVIRPGLSSSLPWKIRGIGPEEISFLLFDISESLENTTSWLPPLGRIFRMPFISPETRARLIVGKPHNFPISPFIIS